MSGRFLTALRSAAHHAMGWLASCIFGKDFKARRHEEAVAEDRVHALSALLVAQPGPVREDQLEDLQGRTLVLSIARARKRSSRPIWRHPERAVIGLLVLVTSIGLVGITFPAASIRVRLDARVDQVQAVIEPGGSDSPIQLGLQEFACRAIELSGAPLPGAESGAGVSETLSLEIDNRLGESDVQSLMVREVAIPRGARLSIDVERDWFVLRLTPPAPHLRAGGRFAYRVVLSIPQGATGVVRGDGRARPFALAPSPLGPESRVIAGNLVDAPVELQLRIDPQATEQTIRLGLQGVDVADLALGDYRDSADQRPRSYLLGGELSFPGRELDPIVLAHGETLSLSDERGQATRGQLLELWYVNRGSPVGASDPALRDQHMHLLWDGLAHAVTLGTESRQQSHMPKLIYAWLGSRQQLYLIGIIVYAGIFAYSLVMKSQPGATDSLQPTELMN